MHDSLFLLAGRLKRPPPPGSEMSTSDLANVELVSGHAGTCMVEIDQPKPPEENIFAIDHYEILRVGPQADEETLERVYRTLAERFHPDNPRTGDREIFLRLSEAYETLSDPALRAKYNVLRRHGGGSARFSLRGREFFDGVRGGQNRRLAVLCVLYRQQISNPDSPGLTLLDLELLTGCTREELSSGLWYLCEKKWATIGERTQYCISAEGFDFVERELEERLEFRAPLQRCSITVSPPHGKNRHKSSPVSRIEDRLQSGTSQAKITTRPQALRRKRTKRTVKTRMRYASRGAVFKPDDPDTDKQNIPENQKGIQETLSDHGEARGVWTLSQGTGNRPGAVSPARREKFPQKWHIKGEQNHRAGCALSALSPGVE